MIRVARPDDFERARGVIEAAHSVCAYSHIPIDWVNVERLWIAVTAQPTTFAMVVEKDGEIVGALLACMMSATFGGRIATDIINYSKAESHKLARLFLLWAEQNGADDVQLTDISGSDRHRRLLKALGLHHAGNQFSRGQDNGRSSSVCN